MYNRNKSSIVKRVLFSALVIGALALPPMTYAAEINFDQFGVNPVGTLTFDGTKVTGVGFNVNSLAGFNTPFNPGATLNCLSCILSFETGALSAGTPPGGPYTFAAGGTFVLVGDIPPAAGAPPHPGNGAVVVLASGTFTEASLSIIGSNTFVFGGVGDDTKDKLLVEYFMGIGSNTPTLIWEGSTTALGGTGIIDPVTGVFTSTNILLSDFANVVPEPGTMLLMLFGLGSLAIRRRSRS